MGSGASQFPSVIESSAYRKDLETLRKSHKLLDELIAALLTDEIEANPTCGWPIRGWNSRVYKIRIADKCHNRGKSNGFRLIYDWNAETRTLVFLRLYTHAQMEDIAFGEIKKARDAEGLN
jgi:mRNA-degrading endonuclease RelE of RelBE toxin-antitoxin system